MSFHRQTWVFTYKTGFSVAVSSIFHSLTRALFIHLGSWKNGRNLFAFPGTGSLRNTELLSENVRTKEAETNRELGKFEFEKEAISKIQFRLGEVSVIIARGILTKLPVAFIIPDKFSSDTVVNCLIFLERRKKNIISYFIFRFGFHFLF